MPTMSKEEFTKLGEELKKLDPKDSNFAEKEKKIYEVLENELIEATKESPNFQAYFMASQMKRAISKNSGEKEKEYDKECALNVRALLDNEIDFTGREKILLSYIHVLCACVFILAKNSPKGKK